MLNLPIKLFSLFVKLVMVFLVFSNFAFGNNANSTNNLKELNEAYKTVGVLSYKGVVCTATLVATNVVLTSRACMQEQQIDASKIVFEIKDPVSNISVKSNGVAFIGYNKFTVNNQNNSWALVQLNSPLPSIFKPVEISSENINSKYEGKEAHTVGFAINGNKLDFHIQNSCFFNTNDLKKSDNAQSENMSIQLCKNDSSKMLDGSAVFYVNKSGALSLIGIKGGLLTNKENGQQFNIIIPVNKSFQLLQNLRKNSNNNANTKQKVIKGIEI